MMRVLQIAYYYPPMGGAGVQRALKFSKYLPMFGIEPVVLGAFDPHYVLDASLTAEIPVALQVHRVEHKSLMSRLTARHRTAAGATRALAEPSEAQRRARGIALALLQTLQYPDDKGAWARRALHEGRQIIRQHAASGMPIETIFTSSPPISAHGLGERLSDEFGLPWIADFRDLWTDNPDYHAPGWRQRLDRRLEQRWLDRAHGVVTVTASWREMLAARRAPEASVVFIPNGYDEDDFRGVTVPPRRADDAFTLVHTGTFYGPRDTSGLLAGLSRYLAEPQYGRRPLRVRLIGNMSSRSLAQINRFSVQHPSVVERIEYLPHAEAVGELTAADALLLVVGGGHGLAARGWLPGKIFEYLRAAKPVLMLGDKKGDAAQLIRDYTQGWVVDDQDADGAADALRTMLDAKVLGTGLATVASSAPTESFACFERRVLAKQLAAFIRQCVAKHNNAPRTTDDV